MSNEKFSDRLELARRKMALSPERQEALERRLRGELAVASDRPSIARRAAGAEAVLSFAQERLWFLQGLEPASTAFTEHVVLRFRGSVNAGALLASLAALMRRHSALRTSVREDGGVPRQVVHAGLELVPTKVSLLSLPAEEREAALRGRLRDELARPFELSKPPLVRVLWVEVEPEQLVLLWMNHHIICDGQSRGVLIRELIADYAALCRGGRLAPAAARLEYGDYATWEREELAWSDGFRRQLAYWKEKLGEGRPELLLPTDRARPREQAYAGGVRELTLKAELVASVGALARARGVTSFSVLLAAFFALLHKHSGQGDIVVGVPTTGRRHAELEPLVGLLINTVCVRITVDPEQSFDSLLARTGEAVADALANADVPFERVVRELSPERDPSRSPLFQALFSLQSNDVAPVGVSGLELGIEQLEAGTSRLDLSFELVPVGDALQLKCEYATSLFDAETIERWTRRYVELLERALTSSGEPIRSLAWVPAAEREQVLAFGRGPDAPIPGNMTLLSAFVEQAERAGDEVALEDETRALTYRAVWLRVEAVARALMRHGVREGDRVLVCLDHGVPLVLALLGVWRAGATYVPLDPTYPVERSRFLAKSSRAAVVLTQRAGSAPLALDSGARVLYLDDVDLDSSEAGAGPGEVSLAAMPSPDRAAYVMYTSGSTGEPKGVVVTHRNLVSFSSGMARLLPEPSRRSTWIALTSFAFDISVLELLWPLTQGHRVVVPAGLHASQGQADAARRPIGFSLFFFAAEAEPAAGDKFGLVLEAAKFGDRNGFEALWTPERHFHSFGGLYPNPSVLSAALAVLTENIQIRAGSVVLPLHHPARVVEEWSVVDNLSKGRVGISFAAGWHADDFALAPQRYAERRRVLVDGLDRVRRLWRGEALELENGAGGVSKLSTLPRPVQPELPVWLTSSGSASTFELAGKQGAFLLTHLLGQSVDELGVKIAAYRAAWKAAGHAGEGHVTLMLHTFIGDDLDAVKAIVRGPFRRYLQTSLDLIENLAAATGVDIRAASFKPEDMEALLDHAFDRYFSTSSLMGTVDSCLPMLDRLHAIGVNELGCLIDFGVSTDAVLDSLPRLARLRDAWRPRREHRVEAALGGYVERFGATHFQCTPSVAQVLVRDSEAEQLGQLELLLVGGEAMTSRLGEELVARVPRVFNMYGPTETTIWSSAHRVNERDREMVPIGQPLANTRLYVLDSERELLPPGVIGELYIGGDGVAREYLGRQDLTDARFFPDPFVQAGGARMYRTGDRAAWSRSGELIFHGRQDDQVKMRGFRIELGEVEAVLSKHPAVKEAAVALVDDAAGGRLVAYVVGRWGVPVRGAEVRAHLQGQLPEYMVPSLIVAIDALPRTPNGKLDRKALPAPQFDREAARAPYVPPRTTIERELVELWSELLGAKTVGVDDNFFEIGGHSLLATQLVARLRSRYARALSLRAFMSNPKISAVAALVSADGAEAAQ